MALSGFKNLRECYSYTDASVTGYFMTWKFIEASRGHATNSWFVLGNSGPSGIAFKICVQVLQEDYSYVGCCNNAKFQIVDHGCLTDSSFNDNINAVICDGYLLQRNDVLCVKIIISNPEISYIIMKVHVIFSLFAILD